MTRYDLEHIKWLNDRINQKLERIYLLKQRALPSAIRYDKEKTSGATVFDPMAEIFAEIDEEERKVTKLIDQLHREKVQAIKEIRKLESRRERNILYLRYIALLSWDEVERYVNVKDKCSRMTMFRLHNQAVDKLGG